MSRSLLVGLVVVLMAPLPCRAQAVQGIQLFEQHCASCHGITSAAAAGRAPGRDALRQLTPESIVATLTSGSMAGNAAGLSDRDKRVLAEQLTGRPLGTLQAGQAATMKNRCVSGGLADPDQLPAWTGWGNDSGNSRYQPSRAAGLSATDLPSLKLKWAFGFPGGASAFSQPTVAGGRVFVGSDIGYVYALDQRTGCLYWSYQTEASVRTAPAFASVVIADKRRYALFFGDLKANVYAVDAETGALIWTRHSDDHPFARITGTPVLSEGLVYVPVSSFEEVSAGSPQYTCCSFRGSVVAYESASGTKLWKTYLLAESTSAERRGPAGAAIWGSPSIDRKRHSLYVATGNAYTQPAAETTDAVVALDLFTGKRLWVNQLTPKDAFIVGCSSSKTNANCPDALGPDFDFGNAPILRTLPNGRDIIVIGQKSGVGWGLEPETGAVVWERRVGRGSATGGMVWGSAADDEHVYFPVSDALLGPGVAGGLAAVKLATGELAWSTRPPPMQCGDRPCTQAQAAAVSVIPGAVFSGTTSGMMRAYSSNDGKILWEYNAVRDYDTVNGVPAKGGSFNGPGPAIAGGMIFFNAGYAYISGGIPGNVLLAFEASR